MLMELGGAAADVTGDEVGVRVLEALRREDMPRDHSITKAGRVRFDTRLYPLDECGDLAVVPSTLDAVVACISSHVGRHVGVRPCRLRAGGAAGWI